MSIRMNRVATTRRGLLEAALAAGTLGMSGASLLTSGARAAAATRLRDFHRIPLGCVPHESGRRQDRRHSAVGEGPASHSGARRRAGFRLFPDPNQISHGAAGLSRARTWRRSGCTRRWRFRPRHLGPGPRPGGEGTQAGRSDLWSRRHLRRIVWLEKPGQAAQLPEFAAPDAEPQGQLREQLRRLFHRGLAGDPAIRGRVAGGLRPTDGVAGGRARAPS